MIRYLSISGDQGNWGPYSQFRGGLPDVVQIQYIGVIDELHDNDFSLDAQQHLIRSSACLGHGHARRDDEAFGHDFDGGVLAGDGMFSDLDAAWGISAQA